MSDIKQQLELSAEFLKSRLDGFVPEVLLVLGSGLGFLGDICENPKIFPYGEIPAVPVSTAPGHAGRLVFGVLGGKRVMVMQGRFHGYEGYGSDVVVHCVRTAKMLGAETMFITNAAGAVNRSYKSGDIMMITDHIKLFTDSPLKGANLDFLGTRFPDMSTAYTPELFEVANKAAAKAGIGLKEGVYMIFPGPQYETPAEIRAAALLGADCVGMSTVPEVIAARHCGMKVLGFSLVCNMAAGILKQELSEQEVLDTAEASKKHFSALIIGCLEELY